MIVTGVLVSLLGTFHLSGQFEDAPAISARAAIVVDGHNGRVLYGKNIHSRSYPASTTKILTALLLLKNTEPTDSIVAPEDTLKVTGSSLHMQPGERISAKEMLYGLLLRSANDGAHATAVKIAGSDEKFAEMMNDFAREIGCQNTQFCTPHGLNHDYHLTTAFDLSRMAIEALKHPEMVRVASTKKYWITRSINQKDLLLVNNNKLLENHPEFQGFKTGWTVPAGKCFVGYADYDEERYIIVVLDSADWQKDSHELAEWGNKKFELANSRLMMSRDWKIPVQGGKEPDTYLRVQNSDFLVSLADMDAATVKPEGPVVAPVKGGRVIPNTYLCLSNGDRVWVHASSMQDVPRAFSLLRWIFSPAGLLTLLIAGGVAYWRRSRKRRNGRRRNPRRN